MNLTDKLPTFTRCHEETLWQLFKNGPTWDGNMISKSHRSDLTDMGYADRGDGWNWLTTEGVLLCLELGMGRDDRKQRHTLQTPPRSHS
jgi:hypothetical protein